MTIGVVKIKLKYFIPELKLQCGYWVGKPGTTKLRTALMINESLVPRNPLCLFNYYIRTLINLELTQK